MHSLSSSQKENLNSSLAFEQEGLKSCLAWPSLSLLFFIFVHTQHAFPPDQENILVLENRTAIFPSPVLPHFFNISKSTLLKQQRSHLV